jgi:large conductance mechanosensitive channel
MLKGFRDFIFRGNVIDLAVAVVIGAAFTAVVTVFGSALITPIINSFFALVGVGKDSIGGSIALPGDQVINIGAIISAIITFLITAAVVYFVFVAPMNVAKSKLAKESGVDDNEPIETALLREIRDLLRDGEVDLSLQKSDTTSGS